MTTTFSVIVPVYNALPHLRKHVKSVISAKSRFHGTIEVIFVDNHSTDGSYSFLKNNIDDDCRVLKSNARTVAGVRNDGAFGSSGEFLVFLDSDCVVSEAHFQNLESILLGDQVCATGAMVDVLPSTGPIAYTWYQLKRSPTSGPVNYINSANFAVRACIFEAIGGFDASLESGEDAEICQRLRHHGCLIQQRLELTSIHLDVPETSREFFKQQVWHGLGFRGTLRWGTIDKPTVAAVIYLFSWMTAFYAILASDPLSAQHILLAVITASGVPAAASGYKMIRARRIIRPVMAVYLFHLYFCARLLALVATLLKPVRSKWLSRGWK